MSKDTIEEVDVAGEDYYKFQKCATMYIIQTSKGMVKEYEIEQKKKSQAIKTSMVRLVLEAIEASLIQALKSGSTDTQDVYGVYIVGGTKSESLLTPIVNIGAKGSFLDEMKNFSDLMYDNEELSKLVEPNDENKDGLIEIAKILESCQGEMRTHCSNTPRRRFIYFTDCDNPCPDGLSAAKQTALDITETGATILPTLVYKGETNKLDPEIFWSELPLKPEFMDIVEEEPAFVEIVKDTDLSGLIISRVFKKHTMGHLMIEFGKTDGNGVGQVGDSPGISIGCKSFILHKGQTLPTPVKMERDEDEKVDYNQVKSKRTKILEDADADPVPVEKEKLNYYKQTLGSDGTPIYFPVETVEQINNNPNLKCTPGKVHILGFKPMRLFQPHYVNVTTPLFLFPSETKLTGSTKGFESLRQAMLSKDQFAMAWCMPRRNATARLYALIATRLKEDRDKGVIETPEGMFLLPIAFKDEIREPPKAPKDINELLKMGEEENDDGMGVVDDLSGILRGIGELGDTEYNLMKIKKPNGYEPRRYKNSKLHNFYERLISSVVGKDPNIITDSTIMSKKLAARFDERIGPCNEAFNKLFEEKRNLVVTHELDIPEQSSTVGNKKSNTSTTAPTKDEMSRYLFNNQGAMTVAQLKAYAVSVNWNLQSSRKVDIENELKRVWSNL